MINNYTDSVSYLGNGTQTIFTFPYKVTDPSQILIMVFNTTDDSLVFEETGDEGINVQSTVLNSLSGGGLITLPAALANDRKLIIKLSMESVVQPFQFREQNDFKIRSIENALDSLVTHVQRLYEKSKRAIGFDDKISYDSTVETQIITAPEPDMVIATDATTGKTIGLRSISDLIGSSGSGLPAGTAAGEVLTYDGTQAGWTQYAFTGFSGRFSQMFTSTDLMDTLSKILNITYAAPTISLSGTSNSLREKGTVVPSVTLTANSVRNSNPITRIQILDGVISLVDLNPPASPNSQSTVYTYSTPFSDVKTFNASVTDGTGTGNSSVTYNFVYPYYRGAGAAGLTNVQIAALTKEVITQNGNLTRTITATAGQVFYFSYPSSYPALTSILDVNNFETIGDWTVRTVTITGLDATAQSYRVYEFNNPVVAGSYQYTFRV